MVFGKRRHRSALVNVFCHVVIAILGMIEPATVPLDPKIPKTPPHTRTKHEISGWDRPLRRYGNSNIAIWRPIAILDLIEPEVVPNNTNEKIIIIVGLHHTSRDPQRSCEAVRSAILAIAWLLVLGILQLYIRCFG